MRKEVVPIPLYDGAGEKQSLVKHINLSRPYSASYQSTATFIQHARIEASNAQNLKVDRK